VRERTGGAAWRQSPSADRSSATGANGTISETCFEDVSDSSGEAACSDGRIGTISPTEPLRWLLPGCEGGRGGADAAVPPVPGSSGGTGKALWQEALGQRTIFPRSVACTW